MWCVFGVCGVLLMFGLRVLFLCERCMRSVSSASVTLGVGIYVMCLWCVLVYMLYV